LRVTTWPVRATGRLGTTRHALIVATPPGCIAAVLTRPRGAGGRGLLGLAGIAVARSLLARRFVRHTALLFAVLLVQWILGKLGADEQAWFGALHAANALAVMVTAGTLARRTAGATGERMQAPDIADPGFVNIVRR
jgi:hypothetical protein